MIELSHRPFIYPAVLILLLLLFDGWGISTVACAALKTRTPEKPGEAQPSAAAVRQAIVSLETAAQKQAGRTKQRTLWRATLAANLERAGRLEDTSQLAQNSGGAGWTLATANELGLALRQSTNGIRLQSLFDLRQQQELLASNSLPLFQLTLRHAKNKKEWRLTSDNGWRQATLRQTGRRLVLNWENPQEAALQGLRVSASVLLDDADNALRWKLSVANTNAEWSVWRVVFPQVALADLGDGSSVLFPRGPGEVQKGVWKRAFKYRGNYPGGWCSMQFLSAYRETENPTGLYFAVHDPLGSTKDIVLESDPATRSVRMFYDHPSANMGVAGNDFELGGEAVWQLLRGDWFDAATLYRDWVRKEARWWPRLSITGREDTPLWMRELSVWAMTGGGPPECVSRVQQFQQYLGMPAGFHWYNWHQIPFDNDYPHYFPAKTNFTQGVLDLQKSGVFVMPYINGRLWDTHDQGARDFAFSARALPAATKKDDGTPFAESYGSKETNGQPVRLAAMCPSTALWQQTVRDTVLKLLTEAGTKAVYIDQVAAAPPTLCMDATHGHPLGGGHWWNEGYWKMLDSIRQAMPRDSMLTTECNGEPFVRWFDGYLTWHWQYDGQVPAFPAVYGGALQMFGRAYRGGATKDLALRMKAGQQLVFGEQLGWLDPNVVKEKANAEFFRQAAQLRWKFRRYFSAGEMARPPKLAGPLPKVKADWQWSGEWWVTTDAVLAGAWRMPKEKRMVLLFANVSDESVTASLRFDALAYGIRARKVKCTVTKGADVAAAAQDLAGRIEQQITFAPRQTQAWELTW